MVWTRHSEVTKNMSLQCLDCAVYASAAENHKSTLTHKMEICLHQYSILPVIITVNAMWTEINTDIPTGLDWSSNIVEQCYLSGQMIMGKVFIKVMVPFIMLFRPSPFAQ